MITVWELVHKLNAYMAQHPDNCKQEIMLAYDGDVAFEFGRGDTHEVMDGAAGQLHKVLVLIPDCKGKRLKMKPSLIING